MTQVRESAAGKLISVYVVIKDSKVVTRIHARYGDACTVDVFDDHRLVHQGRATGGGYDKFTAALAGASIQGIKMLDHCETASPEGGYIASGLGRLSDNGFTVEQVF